MSLSRDLNLTAAGNCSEEERDFYREEGLLEMWKQITGLNIWQGRFEFQKRIIEECIQHLRIENSANTSLSRLLSHKKGYAKPGSLYLLNKFQFDGHILAFASRYRGIDEQITFSVIDYLRTQYKNKNKI